jgi:geranylgeranyl pyrophosphate synthase
VDGLATHEFKAYLKRFLLFQELLNKRLAMNATIQEVLLPIQQRPGKQLRPRLFLLAAQHQEFPDSAIHIAVGIELLHLASIIHVDILDGSPNRRGRDALWQSRGARAALLCGDFLFAEAFSEFSQSGLERRLFPMMRTLIAGMVKAELMQSNLHFAREIDERLCRRIMRLKTARFFAVSAGLGVMASGGSRRGTRRAYQFGLNFGMAYQLADDLRDLVTEDLNRGILTLPALWIGQSSAQGRKLLDKICKQKRIRADDPMQLNNLLQETGISLQLERAILSYLRAAENALSELPAWNRMRLRQFVNDIEPYLLLILSENKGSWEARKAKSLQGQNE